MSGGEFDGAGILEGAVLRAVDAAGISKNGKYSAAIEMALVYARQIDRVPVDAGQDRTKVLYLGPHFMNALSALGLTPRGEAEIRKIIEQSKVEAAKASNLEAAAKADKKSPAMAAASPAPGGAPSSVSKLDEIRNKRRGTGGSSAG